MFKSFMAVQEQRNKNTKAEHSENWSKAANSTPDAGD